ncbi:MAG: protein kinase [Gemmatimonas sp.]
MVDEKAAAFKDLAPDSMFGPYRIKRILGRGGMGVVYEAAHEDGRVVALKLLTVDLDKMDARERFLREGLAAAGINHPNAVYIYGTEEIDGTPAITMEIVPGGTLDEKIKERGALPLSEAVEDMLQIIDGLDAAYAAGILHRDVKPSNCFLGPNGTLKIGDFGLSKPVAADDRHKLTQTGMFIGTPVFSSPEQLLGESLDVRSDIYAVGVTFYSMLTGELPYQSGSMMQVVAAVLNGVPAPITNFRKDLPPAAIDVVLKAMARKATDRYQSYAELRSAVAALRVIELEPATLWDRARASIVDWGVNLVLVLAISFVAFRGTFSLGSGRASSWQQVAVSLIVTLLVVGIPEALRGRSIGKWLVGIRVTGPDGGPPGFLREFGRISILAIADIVGLIVQMRQVTANNKTTGTFLATLILRGILFLSVRRSNGWRMLHDIITGTRVSRSRVSSEQRRGETHRTIAPTLSGNERRIGPYVVISDVRADGTVLNGWDATMRRAVWIVSQNEHAPEATAARRSLSRLTRLRWVGGRRAPNDSWDAFEAPIGEPLSARLTTPVPWPVQQNWLLDIANEMAAAEADDTALKGLSADSIWITPTDRIVFLEGDASAAPTVLPNGTSTPSLVAQLFDRIQATDTFNTPLPGYAVRAIATARAATNLNEVRTLVQATLGRPIAVTRARRVGLLVTTIAPILLFSALGWFTTSQASRLDRAGFMVASLVSFVADSARTIPDSVKKRAIAAESNPKASGRIARAMESIGILPVATTDTSTPPDTLRRQRHLAEVYVSTVLSARARDTITPSSFGRTEKDVQRRLAILQRNSAVDSADARAARFLVDSIWKGVIPGNDLGTIVKFIPYVLVAIIIFIGAAVSIASGLFVRRGPLLRGFQLDLMTAAGKPAGRVRLLVRNVVIWSVLLMPIPAINVAPHLTIHSLGIVLVGSAAMYGALWAIAVWMSVRSPSRGLAERVSGTWLVPE